MAEEKREYRKTFRLPDDEWELFERATQAAGTDRSKALVGFVRWYNRRPGATMPKRPSDISSAAAA